jgi:hypothetical protein
MPSAEHKQKGAPAPWGRLSYCRAITSDWVYPDRIISDPRGTVVPSDEAAIGAARTIIDDLLEDSGPGQPRPLIMVVLNGMRVYIRLAV